MCWTVVQHDPDCVKTRLFLVPRGAFAEKRLELGRIPYYPLILDTKWDACPFSVQSLDFSHSLEPGCVKTRFVIRCLRRTTVRRSAPSAGLMLEIAYSPPV